MVGIYRITNPKDKVYIGQSWDIDKRIKIHFSQSKKAARVKFNHYPIYNSLNKYGLDQHKVEVIQELPIDVSQSVMDGYEQLYISLHKDAGFYLLNLTEGGNSGKRSQETKDRMSKSFKGRIISPEQRGRISLKLKGTKQPLDVKEKRSAILRNLKRKVTDEHKAILSASLQGNERNSSPVVLLNISTREKRHFTTLKKAAQYLNISYVTFQRYYNGRREGYPHLDKVYGTHTVAGFEILNHIQ